MGSSVTIDIRSTPTNAKVYIDGNYKGRTKVSFWWKKGSRFDLEIRKDGYNDYTSLGYLVPSNSLGISIHRTLKKKTTVKKDKDDKKEEEEPEEEPEKEKLHEIKESDFTGTVGSLTNPYRLKIGTETWKRIGKALSEERAADLFGAANIKATLQSLGLVAGTGIITGLTSLFAAGTAGVATTSGALASGLGIAGLSIPAAAAKLAVKGAMGIAGFDGIMVWMASDNVLTGTAFTVKKLREAVKAKVLNRREVNEELDIVQQWIDAATKLVEISAAVNPFIIPFRRILLINAEKAQKDFDLEKELINVELKKQ